MDSERISGQLTLISLYAWITASALVVLAAWTVGSALAEATARDGAVGRSTGYAVAEHHQFVTSITSDPTQDYLVLPGEPLPPAAPGADR